MVDSNIPEELVMDILSRLPVKSLIRCRCLSKTWLRLLTTNSHFVKLHLARSIESKNPSILALKKSGTLSEEIQFYFATELASCDEAIDLELPFDSSNSYDVYGICNGLLCLADQYENVYIWNPLTRDYICFHSRPTPPSRFSDPLQSTTFAFGFDQATDVYKLIRFVCESRYSPSEYHCHVNVYDIGTEPWGRTLEDISYCTRLLEFPAPLVNGCLHWLVCKTGLPASRVILSFDLKDEGFHEIPHPNDVDTGAGFEGYLMVGELDGLLCVFVNSLLKKNVQIWVMKEYGAVESWRQQIKIERPEIIGLSGYLQPLGVADNGEIILMKDLLELILYCPKTNSIMNLPSFQFELCNCVHTFSGSLVSPRAITGARLTMA